MNGIAPHRNGHATARDDNAFARIDPPIDDVREELDRWIHPRCPHRRLNELLGPHQGRAQCPVDRFLPELVEITGQLESADPGDYARAVRGRICTQCGNQDNATGDCPVRAAGKCCLDRNLQLIIRLIDERREEAEAPSLRQERR